MKTSANNISETKSQTVTRPLPKHSSGTQSPFQFADNRPAAAGVRALQEGITHSPQVKQLQAYQAMADNKAAGISGPAPVQRKLVGAPYQLRTYVNQAGVIRQTESKGTPWTQIAEHGAPIARSAGLTTQVEQFKTEILTWIADSIKQRATVNHVRNTPHIAVVIKGDTCHVAMNSMTQADPARLAAEAELLKVAKLAMSDIRFKYRKIQAHYGGALPVLTAAQQDQQEALYITLRWAAKASNVIARPVPRQTGAVGAIHGEMNILQNAFNDSNAPAAGWKRVIRVGGTKTPCFDCGQVMGVHGGAGDAAPFAHSAMSVRETGGDHRRVWTGGPTYGPGFPNWRDPINHNQRAGGILNPPAAAAPAFNAVQQQSTAALQAAMQFAGIG